MRGTTIYMELQPYENNLIDEGHQLFWIIFQQSKYAYLVKLDS